MTEGYWKWRTRGIRKWATRNKPSMDNFFAFLVLIIVCATFFVPMILISVFIPFPWVLISFVYLLVWWLSFDYIVWRNKRKT